MKVRRIACSQRLGDNGRFRYRRHRQIPVAGIEAAEMVGIETVSEVCGDAERLKGVCFPQSAGDGTVAVYPLPGAFMSGGQLLRTHIARLEDDVLAVVQLPVTRKNPI